MTANPSDQSESTPSEAAPEEPIAQDTPTEAPADQLAAAAEAPERSAEDADAADQSAEEPAAAGGSTGEAPAGDSTDEPAAGDSTDEPAAEAAPAADEPVAADAGSDQEAEAAETGAEAAPADSDAAPPEDAKAEKKGKKGEKAEKKAKKPEKKKPSGPDPRAIVKRIGATSEAALAYVQSPDPQLSRMSRKNREAIITEIPPVTAGALLGPDALCRHFLASAAAGRYRDLFWLWDLFVAFPEECKPVLGSRQRTQQKARGKMEKATHLGLLGDANRVAEDITRAAGLPWRWLKEILEPLTPAIVGRPAVLAAMINRGAGEGLTPPETPSDRWLAEAAQLKDSGADVPEVIDQLLGQHADRLPASISTLSMAQAQFPERVPALIDRVDLDGEDIGSIMAWARDHGQGERLAVRIAQDVREATKLDRASGLATWAKWRDRGVSIALPDVLTAPTIDGLDLGKPESAELIKILIDQGADMSPQGIVDTVAAENWQKGEKAYEAFVCVGFDVHLPLTLEGNPGIPQTSRCRACQAWTWVRPKHEERCPRIATMADATDGSGVDAGAQVDAALDAIAAPVAAAPAAAPAPPSERPSSAPAPSTPPAPAPSTPPAPAPSTPPAAATPASGGAADWTASAEQDAALPTAAAPQAPVPEPTPEADPATDPADTDA